MHKLIKKITANNGGVFTGNGTKSPGATATVYNGTIVKIEMNDSGSGKSFGAGYDYASVVFSGGGGSLSLIHI